MAKYLAHYADATVVEAAKASFEYEDRTAFDREFIDTVIAISRENVHKILLPNSRYMTVEPINRLHTSDIEKTLYTIRDGSRCKVRQVGAAILEHGRIVSQSSNTCTCADNYECLMCKTFLDGKIAESRTQRCQGLHAETAVISSLAPKRDNSTTILLVTTAPCGDCAKNILDAEITTVIYFDDWKRRAPDSEGWFIETAGLDFLRAHDIAARKAGT
jgi:deoxycytidylate deaminase